MATVSFYDLNPIYGNQTLYLGVPRWYYQDLKNHFEITIDESLQSWQSVDMTDGKWIHGRWGETWKHGSNSNRNVVFVRSAANNIDAQATISSWEMHQRDFGSKVSYYLYHSEIGAIQYLMFRFQSPGDEAWFKLVDGEDGYKITQHPMIIPCSLHGCWLKTNWSLALERIEVED